MTDLDRAFILLIGALGLIDEPKQEVVHFGDAQSMVITTYRILGKSYRCISYYSSFDKSFEERDKRLDTINNITVRSGDANALALYKEHGYLAVAKLITTTL